MNARSLRSLAVAVLVVGASSCVGWRTDDFDRSPLAPLVATPELTYHLVVTGPRGEVVAERGRGQGLWSINEWTGVEDVLAELGARVERADAPSSLPFLDLHVTYAGDRWRWLTFLSGITLTVIPAWQRTTTTLDARITVPGQPVAEYSAEGGVFGWFWLPLVLGTPFANPAILDEHVPFDLLRGVLRQAVEDGVLR